MEQQHTNNPLITVVTVTYNAENYLEETIESIINQTYKNIEYIIIDGASSDKTVNIIKKYEKHISYWVSEVDNGIYDAMNKAIDVANGEWINFMNAGDSFADKNIIEKVIENSYNADVICGNLYYVTNYKKEYIKVPGLKKAYECMFCNHQAMFVKTSLMKKYKFDTSFKIAGDYDLTLKLYSKGYNFKFLDLIIANFIAGGDSERDKIRARIENIFIISKYTKDITKIFNSQVYTQLQSYSLSNNKLFSHMLNMLYKEFDRLKLKDKRFVLYGFGNVGKIIENEFGKNIVAIIDKNYKELKNTYPYKHFLSPKALKDIDFDYIVISVLSVDDSIKKELIKKFKIENEKIIQFKLKI